MEIHGGCLRPERRERIESEVSRLVQLGAGIVREVDEDGFHVVMRDVEGNEFCVA